MGECVMLISFTFLELMQLDLFSSIDVRGSRDLSPKMTKCGILPLSEPLTKV